VQYKFFVIIIIIIIIIKLDKIDPGTQFEIQISKNKRERSSTEQLNANADFIDIMSLNNNLMMFIVAAEDMVYHMITMDYFLSSPAVCRFHDGLCIHFVFTKMTQMQNNFYFYFYDLYHMCTISNVYHMCETQVREV